MNSSPRPLLALASLFAATHPVALSAAPSVEETTLVADVTSATINLSPRGAHAAVVIPKGSRQAVVFDGVEGPRFDQVQMQPGEYLFTGNGGRAEPRNYAGATSATFGALGGGGNRPVLFSDDGQHWAYAARIGNEFMLMHDGQEVHRGPYQQISWMAFSPGSARLVATATSVDTGQNCLIIDGKPGPWGAEIGEVFFTPDGAHYAYSGRQNDAQQTRWTVVDGRQVKFIGDLVGFLPNGTLLSRAQAQGLTILLANGKPISQVGTINHLATAPVTGRIVMAVTPPAGTPPTAKPSVLTVDGQIIAETEGIIVTKVWFSPDGKRYAALCQRTAPRMETFMLVDGKRDLGYQSIYTSAPFEPSFSPDSTQFYYVAMSSQGQLFLVHNGEESDGMQTIPTSPVWLPGSKARLAWGGTTPAQKPVFFIDGKSVPLPNNMLPGSTFRFSPDGSRTTWSFGPPNGLTLIVDGAPLPGVAGTGFVGAEAIDGTNTTVKFSPNSRHVAYAARESTGFTKSGVWMDGAFITPSTRPQFNRVTFTPDSQHVAWAVAGLKNNMGAYEIFFDGEKVLTYTSSPLDNMNQAWAMGADGVLTILAIDDGALKRFRITPAAGSSVATMVAAAGGAAVAASAPQP
ncbi:MAG: hypothetical protein IAE82_13310, partial [Opitutaceae bacterium]|nr:hypothetical protein [Opitutaceae bacterium]